MGSPPGFSYIPAILTVADQRTLLRKLEHLDYQPDIVRGRPTGRVHMDYGQRYGAGGRVRLAPSFEPWLTAVGVRALPFCPSGTRFDQAQITKYPPGAGIGWHCDDLVFGDVIVGVSLAAHARLQFRPKGGRTLAYEVLAAPGSVYVMRDAARWQFEHRIMPVKQERISITLRELPGMPTNRADARSGAERVEAV